MKAMQCYPQRSHSFKPQGCVSKKVTIFVAWNVILNFRFLLFNLHLYYLSYIWLALEIILLRKQAFDKKFFICYSKLNSESPPN